MKATKFNNTPCVGLRGQSFKSKRERDHALWLESERKAGRITAWQYEKSYDLFAAGGIDLEDCVPHFIGRHKPDFEVILPNGTIEVHECKGGQATKTEAWYLRRKIFKANYPHIAYKVFDGVAHFKNGRVIQFD